MILFQLIRTLKLAARFDLLRVLVFAASLNLLFGAAFYYAERGVQEHLSMGDAIWWSMVTMTTVGYGDYYAHTFLGRYIISYPCMLLGIGIIGYLVGTVANTLLDWSARRRRGEVKINLRNHIIICNFPSEEKVLELQRELQAIPVHAKSECVLVCDNLRELPPSLVKAGFHFVFGSCSSEEVLRRANILHCAGVVILAEDPNNARSDDRTYTTGSLIELISRESGRAIKTVVEMVSEKSLRTMERTNVDGIVSTDGVASCLLAMEFQNPGVGAAVNQIITASRGSQLYLHRTSRTGPLVEFQRRALDTLANLQIIGVVQGEKTLVNPDKRLVIADGDTLIVLAEHAGDLAVIEGP